MHTIIDWNDKIRIRKENNLNTMQIFLSDARMDVITDLKTPAHIELMKSQWINNKSHTMKQDLKMNPYFVVSCDSQKQIKI